VLKQLSQEKFSKSRKRTYEHFNSDLPGCKRIQQAQGGM